MNLLLTSAGMRMRSEIEKFVSGVDAPVRVLHVMTAAKREKLAEYMHRDVRAMHEAGWDVEDIDIDNKTENELREILKEIDVVYVQGGNTFYLLDGIRKSGFEKVVREFLDRDGLYIGVSAGTLVAGSSIEKAVGADPNEIGMDDYSGMGFIDAVIDVHCAVGTEIESAFVCLSDDQAILIKGDEVKIIQKEETTTV